MADITLLSGTDTLTASRSTINTDLTALQSCFRGASAPASPIAGQLWLDTSASPVIVLKIRNEANSAWVTLVADAATAYGAMLPLAGGTMTGAIAMGSTKITGLATGTAAGDAINKSQAEARIFCAVTQIGTLSATATFQVFLTTQSYCKIEAAYLVTSTALAVHGSNYWSFGIYNVTDTAYLQSGTGPTTPTGNRLTASTYTAGTATVANTPYSMALNQNQGDLSATLVASKVIQFIATKTGSPSNLSDCSLFVWYKTTT